MFRDIEIFRGTITAIFRHKPPRGSIKIYRPEGSFLYYDIDARVLKEGEYIVRFRATVRQAAKVFGVSKSTVHYDMVKRLPSLDEDLSGRVRELLSINLSERHIRGGIATRKKYKNRSISR